MKKLLAFALVLCLLAASAALAEGAPQMTTEEVLRLREERKELPQKPDFDEL